MAKATHKGTCQVCGRVHRINVKSGMLAKHGYTIDWGWFNGVCSGADNLPYEKSCELVKRSIEQAEDYKRKLADEITETENWTVDSEIIYREYLSYTEAPKGGYYNVKARIVKDSTWRTFGVEFEFGGKIYRKANKECMTGHTAESLLNASRERRIKVLKTHIKNTDNYIALQQKRVDNWKEAELIEIK